ncbi:unnamed protein product, partial [Brassica rapa]
TQRTSVGVRQHTQDVRGCPSAHTGRPWLSVCVCVCLCVSVSTHRTSVAVHQYTYQHAGPWTHHAGPSVDYLSDFGPHGLSHTQDVRGCPSAHTGRPCVSVSTHRTCVAFRVFPCVSVSKHRTSVAVHQYTYRHVGPWAQHADPSRGLFGTHRTSVAVRQHTQDVCGCLCVSVSTHRMTYVAVHVCPFVSVCVCQHTQDVRGCPSVHISAPRWSLDSARWPFPWTIRVILANVGCLFSTHMTSMGVRQHIQDVRGCPSAHTGLPWLSVCVRVTSVAVSACPCVSVCVCQHTHGRPWVSVRTHRTSVCIEKETQDIPWLSITHGTSMAVCVCPCVSVSKHRTYVAVHGTHISTLVLGLSTLAL